jgi:hypothetical protein
VGTIGDFSHKIKAIPASTKEKAFIGAIIILVAFLSFGIGRLSARYDNGNDIKILTPDEDQASLQQG